MNAQIGQIIRAATGEIGWVRHIDGNSVTVEPLPDFAGPENTAWPVFQAADLTPAKVCGCATLGQRRDGVMFTTGCDFSRTPKGRFLPGHDARAKSFLIGAWGHGELVGGFAHALGAARSFSDAIAAKVAAGVENANKRDQARRPARRSSIKRPAAPASREDTLTPAQRLQREFRVTDPMMEVLATALVRWDGDTVGAPTSTLLALQKRGLVERGGRGVTLRGRQVMDYNLEPDNPVCVPTADYRSPGTYSTHWNTWNREIGYHCRRCGTPDANA